MPPRLARRQPGDLPPPPKRPEVEPAETVSGHETIGEYDVVVVDDEVEEVPDLTIDVQQMVKDHETKKQPEQAPAPKAKPRGNPFLPRISIIDKIRP